MKPVRTLALLPLRQSRIATGVLLAVLVAGEGMLVLLPQQNWPIVGMMFAALALLFLWVNAGTVLRQIARQETLLLPGFRLALFKAALLWALLFLLLPALPVALHWGAGAGWMALGYGALLAAWVIFSVSGTRYGWLLWMVFVGFILLPAPLHAFIVARLHGPLAPLLGLLLALLVVRVTWRKLFPGGDPPLPSAPIGLPDPLQRGVTTGTATPGKLRRLLEEWSGRGASMQLQQQLQRYRRAPGAARQRAVLRVVLMPHEQPRGWLVRTATTAIVLAVYLLVIGHGSAPMAFVGGYVIFFAMLGLNVIGRGLPRLRPSLGELYLTLALPTRAAFAAQLVDSLLGALPGAVLAAYVYTVLAAALSAGTPWLLALATTTAIAPPLALGTLALHLLLPDNRVARTLALVVIALAQVASYSVSYLLIEHFGPLWAGLPLALVAWGFAFGAWSAARAQWMTRPLDFSPPDTRNL